MPIHAHSNESPYTQADFLPKNALASKFETGSKGIYSSCSVYLFFSSVSVYLFPQKDQFTITLVKVGIRKVPGANA